MPPDTPADTNVFFVDRSLGKKLVVKALRDAGVAIEAHDDHFDEYTENVEWLTETGRRGWIVLTKDQRIWRNRIEREIALKERVRMFILAPRSSRR